MASTLVVMEAPYPTPMRTIFRESTKLNFSTSLNKKDKSRSLKDNIDIVTYR